MSNRSSIVMATVTVGALALSTAALVGAYTVVDNRATQIFNSEPRGVPSEKRSASPAHASRTTVRSGGTETARGAAASGPRTAVQTKQETVGSAAAGSAAGPPPASEQGNTGETRLAPEAMPNGQHERRAEAHHGRKHARRLARSSHGAGTLQGAGGQSAFFFPFR